MIRSHFGSITISLQTSVCQVKLRDVALLCSHELKRSRVVPLLKAIANSL